MQKIYYLFVFILIVFSCKQACKEDIQSPHTIYKPIVTSLIPYIGYEKLRFLRNSTDTLTFYGQGIKTDYSYTSTQDDCTHAGASVRSFHLLKIKNNNE
jgi:hypothetical protein